MTTEAGLQVLEGIQLVDGRLNVDDDTILAQIAASIRRGLPQLAPQPMQPDAIALVCSGPSLPQTYEALYDALAAGAKLVTVNGGYQWCVSRGLIPSMQIVMDARPSTARFVDPALPRCVYAVASQCHASVFDALEGRPQARIFHAVASEEAPAKAILDAYYLKQWHGIGGGTTVGTRAIALLRTLGYLRMEIFGLDSCWLDGQHHAMAQPENHRDRRIRLSAHPTGHPDLARDFICAPWHLQQVQDALQFIRCHGHQVLLRVHGPGLIAFALESNADIAWTEREG